MFPPAPVATTALALASNHAVTTVPVQAGNRAAITVLVPATNPAATTALALLSSLDVTTVQEPASSLAATIVAARRHRALSAAVAPASALSSASSPNTTPLSTSQGVSPPRKGTQLGHRQQQSQRRMAPVTVKSVPKRADRKLSSSMGIPEKTAPMSNRITAHFPIRQ